ncbi:nuclease-related domain-containing protein [uncultured Methylophaga sp.]|uniref:nuclease-related domain-containing protein n=1 Tax=uncultured Methylophaga sp. TaxID=285271 RepID=UPI002623E820|nr:nuclease-related domain-containing protein [uncultured Methylophaga sp.]
MLFLFVLVKRRNKKTIHLREIERALLPLKHDEVRGVVIPDGIGGLLEIDRLVLTEHGLLIIESYPISGHLFGSEQIDQWTQILEGRSFKFANPIRHIHNAKYALQILAPKLPVHCRIVFTADSDFPKGRPEVVSTLSSLEQDLKPILQTPKIPASSKLGWQRVLRIARTNGQAVLREATS